MLLQSVLSPAPLLDWAPDAGPKPVWASRTPGSEPHARASGPCLGTELGFAQPYRRRLIWLWPVVPLLPATLNQCFQSLALINKAVIQK
jgi:hypothetical protein